MNIMNHNSVINGYDFSDTLNDRYRNSKKPLSFKEVFGDLSDYIFEGYLDLGSLNLTSLEGCPSVIKGEYFAIDRNPNLATLNFFPSKLEIDMLYLDHHSVEDLKTVNPHIFEGMKFFLSGSQLFNLKYIVLQLEEVRKLNVDFNFIQNGSFSKEDSDINIELERIYSIYEKVGFDQEKLDRAMELI